MKKTNILIMAASMLLITGCGTDDGKKETNVNKVVQEEVKKEDTVKVIYNGVERNISKEVITFLQKERTPVKEFEFPLGEWDEVEERPDMITIDYDGVVYKINGDINGIGVLTKGEEKYDLTKEEMSLLKQEYIKDNMDDLLKEAMAKRKSYGIKGDEDHVKSLIEKGEYNHVWDIYLTKEEDTSFEKRRHNQSIGGDKFDEFLKQNEDIKKNIKEQYYKQSEGGTFYIVFREENKEHEKRVSDYQKKNDYFEIKVIYGVLNEYQLAKMADKIWAQQDALAKEDIPLVGTTPLVIDQYIQVDVGESEKSEEEIKEILIRYTKIEKKYLEVRKDVAYSEFLS